MDLPSLRQSHPQGPTPAPAGGLVPRPEAISTKTDSRTAKALPVACARARCPARGTRHAPIRFDPERTERAYSGAGTG